MRSEKRRHETSESDAPPEHKKHMNTNPSNISVSHLGDECAPPTDIADNENSANRRALESDDQLPHTGPEDPDRPSRGYEYCDHTADIQVHSWGVNLKEAFEECCVGMFGYITDLATVEAKDTFTLEAEGHDMDTLLFHFLDEWLYAFSAEPYFTPNEINILEFDEVNFKIKCEGYGEPFDLQKHPQGTEVKAITYSAMQIKQHDKGYDVYVIVDI